MPSRVLTLLATALATACTPPQATPSSNNGAVPAETVQPEVQADSAPSEPIDETPAETVITANRTGTFESAEHETLGGVELVSDGSTHKLIFDDTFSTSNGPDLVVVLHRSATLLQETPPPAYPLNEGDYVVIAPLTSISGTQEYVIPAEVDINAFQAAAIWCQAFNATFGVATFQ